MCSAIEVLLLYKYPSQSWRVRVSPGLTFNIAAAPRAGQRCAAVFSAVPISKHPCWAQAGHESGEPATGPLDVIYFG